MKADTDAERLAAIEKGLAANPDGETKGILLINKALIMDRSGGHEGAVRLLGELALDPASTYATEHLAKVTLASVTKKYRWSRGTRHGRKGRARRRGSFLRRSSHSPASYLNRRYLVFTFQDRSLKCVTPPISGELHLFDV